ncbi:hypothetical protein ECE50_003590 [Chitinophaga sp. Mgbs1]|uniref:Uncharacterized protein n=1 Tax=Chitinophaga solisilvae TaxID=1233460 RepID=A0A433WIB7_9BACT|nr:hypothetical protein [Chitinophaga solisilvae]
MRHRITWLTAILPLVLLLGSCYKYAERDPVETPAYLRVFNSVAVMPDALQGTAVASFFTFLMDPETDAAGIPLKAAVMGDFLTTRQLYSTSVPLNSGNSSEGQYVIDKFGRRIYSTTPLNYEYPGNAKVLTAAVINGFDLSAWAQITSGKHRIVFVSRPKNSIAFPELSKEIRSQVLIDTVVDFSQGEVYTMQILCRDLEKNQYGLYVRNEQFTHQQFDDKKIYVGFLNLSGAPTRQMQMGMEAAFPQKIRISYSYKQQELQGTLPVPMAGYNNNYYTTLTEKMNTGISYLTLPLLPRASFFEKDTLRSYSRVDLRYTGLVTLPHAEFYFEDADRPGFKMPPVQYSADPSVYNIYRYSSFLTDRQTDINVAPVLNLITSSGNKYHISATVNIMEIIYDRIYMMQVQRGFNEIPH